MKLKLLIGKPRKFKLEARYNMKKPTAKNPLFIINTRKIHVAVDIMKYPKLFKRLHELAKNDNVTPSQKLACLLNNELKKWEEQI